MSLVQAQVAALLDVTPRRVRQMHEEGKGPPRNADGSYDEGDVGRWMRAQMAADVGGYNYEAERARLTHEQADKVSLEVSELRADLVRMSVVEAYWADLGASLRSKLVSIPSKLSALVADPILRAKFHAQSESLIYEGLAEIQKDAVPAAVRSRADRSRRDDVPVIASPAAEADA